MRLYWAQYTQGKFEFNGGTLITRGHPDQLIQVAWTDPT